VQIAEEAAKCKEVKSPPEWKHVVAAVERQRGLSWKGITFSPLWFAAPAGAANHKGEEGFYFVTVTQGGASLALGYYHAVPLGLRLLLPVRDPVEVIAPVSRPQRRSLAVKG